MTETPDQTSFAVEDEPLIRFAVADVAWKAGDTVCKAAAATAALSVLEQDDRVTLVVTDIRMPGKTDGLMLSAVINRRWPCIRILVTSAFHEPSADDMPSGGHFLAKPFTSDALVATIRRITKFAPTAAKWGGL